MSGISISLDTSAPLADLLKSLTEYEKRLNRAIARKVIPPLERDMDRSIQATLAKYPPARGLGSPKFVWSRDPIKNARGRRGFFARHPNGYKRTGELGRSWRAIVVFKDGVILFTIENPSPAASYVYGLPPTYGQVPGHVTTGWRNAGKTIPDILLDVAIRAEDQLKTVAREIITA